MPEMASPSLESDILISVGVPTFNRAALLERRLANIVAQTYQRIEIIVSDNASPDAAVEKVCARWSALDSRVRVFRQPENIGAYNNFLFVLDQARGRYFVWAADDDEWDDDYIGDALARIGDSQLQMPRAAVHYILTGKQYPIDLPCLTSTQSAFSNAVRYLSNAQPTLLYGLHDRDALNQIIPRNTFDLSDMLIVYKAILGKGVGTGGSAEYRAGIPEESYKIKPFGRPGSPGKISYRQAMVGCLSATIGSANLAVGQKLILSFSIAQMMIRTASHLTKTYPETARPHHFLLYQSLLLVSKLKDVLRPLRFWR
jgi:glycosyltransferase involved in cell wall biosynthesis